VSHGPSKIRPEEQKGASFCFVVFLNGEFYRSMIEVPKHLTYW
jgi:hypothetical protein